MLSQLIAYALTALGVLGVGKKYTQKLVDVLLRRQASKKNKSPPADVVRRETVLDEHAITKRNGRRISTVFENVDSISTRPEIELTVIDDQNNADPGDAISFTNPMKQNNNDPVGPAPSAFLAPSMEEKMDQMNRMMREMKKDNIEMKKQLKKLTHEAALRTGKTISSPKTDVQLNKDSKQRTKRLSKVMKARRNSSQSLHLDLATERKCKEKELTVINDLQNADPGDVISFTNPMKPKRCVPKRKSFRKIDDNIETGIYYQNVETGETVWEVPEDGDIVL